MCRAALALAAFLAGATRAWAQCPDGSPPPCGPQPSRAAVPAAPPTSVAVLYFENLSRDTADAYLADGLTEELTGRLGDVERLRVSGRTAVRRAQQAAGDDLAVVGRALNVRYLVEGSVRRAGTQVRVSARLLRASDGVRVWGAAYDRTMTDLLALQEDIAREVVANVAGQLLPAERARLAARPTTDPQAYDHYLRGTYAFNRRSSSGFERAIADLDLALRRDPRFAAAEARRAYALVLAYAYGAEADRDSMLARAARSADRALALDSTAADAWVARAQVAVWRDGDLTGALPLVRRGVALGPQNAEAHHALGVILYWLGEDAASTAAFRQALTIDPARAVTILDLGELAVLARDYPAAARLLDSAIALDPDQARPRLRRAELRLKQGDAAGSLADAQDGLRLATPGFRAAGRSLVAAAHAARGDTAAALAALGSPQPQDRAAGVAVGLLAVGLTDSALAVLEAARPIAVDWADLRFPGFDRVRTDPRFQRIEARWRDVALRRR